jgi:hypothetical protein
LESINAPHVQATHLCAHKNAENMHREEGQVNSTVELKWSFDK